MKKNIVKKLINIWDPLGVYGLAPDDEYDDIVIKIIELYELKANKEMIKNFLMGQYYNENAKNEKKVDELIDLISLL